jgi:uncharacterized repeat protein (TIGR03943 family)
MEQHHHEHTHENQAQEWVKAALLIGLGVYLLVNVLSGSVTNYINARFIWLSVVAVALLIIFGVYVVWGRFQHGHHIHDHDHEHDHGHANPVILLVVAIPLALGVLLPSLPLGAEAINGNISLNAVMGESSGAPRSSDPLDWTVLDWLRIFNEAETLDEVNGQSARIVGFVYSEPTFPADHFMAARFTVNCCVADATAIGLPVRWTSETSLTAGDWIEVTGTFEVGEFRGQRVPILNAESVEPISQPAHPYLYP